MKNDIDIIKNMRTIEWLKAELLGSVSSLYRTFADTEENTKENIEDVLSKIVLETFLLGKRVGIEYDDIMLGLRENIRLNLLEEHKIEKWYGDLSSLLDYIDQLKKED